MKDLNTLLKDKFKDKDFEKQYLRTSTFFKLADELLLLRKKRGLSQIELAEKAGTTQAVVSRLENASVKASLESVVKFAEALDAYVEVRIIPIEEGRKKFASDDECIDQKKSDTLKGIRYFNIENSQLNGDEKKEKLVDFEKLPKKFSMLEGLSNQPGYAPIQSKKKTREYA